MENVNYQGLEVFIWLINGIFYLVLIVTFFNISANIRSLRRHFVSDEEMKEQKKKADDL